MNYFDIQGEPGAVIWQDSDGNSGVLHETTEGWTEFQQWLSEGNELASLEPVDTRSLDELRTMVRSLINDQADIALKPITSLYPKTEIESWPEQCLEANACLANPDAQTPLIDAITGPLATLDKREFCDAILSKAATYKVAVGSVIAWRRAVDDWVNAQVDRERLLGFVPQFPEVPHAS